MCDPLKRFSWRFLAVIALLYGLAYLFAFGADALGQIPVLDARENMAIADSIRSGRLANEPFYRAMLYPYVLSWLPGKPFSASVIGLIGHCLNGLICASIAARVWRDRAAGYVGGLLYAFYPVSLFFAVQVLDITFALTFFLLGVFALLRAGDSGESKFAWFAGLMAGLSVLARPNFLPAVLLFPIIGFWLSFVRFQLWRASSSRFLLILLPLLLVLLFQGWLNHSRSGVFRILPWQGAYNLYAANNDMANGKYYTQRVSFDQVPAGMNTTRMESEYFYRQAVGPDASLSVSAMGEFWHQQLFDHIRAEPVHWVALMCRKVVYLLNDWEQYNNLSYEYHKERFALLHWNPLGWGVLLIGTSVALLFAWNRSSKSELLGLAGLALAYAVGVLLFFVSARFRLPLAPFLAIGAAGLVCVPWKCLNRKQWSGIVGLLFLGATLTYGNWFGAHSRETFKQDQLLLAKASQKLMRDEDAIQFASDALETDSRLEAARRIRIASLFNLWLLGVDPMKEDTLWSEVASDLEQLSQPDATSEFIRGVWHWRSGEPNNAERVWRRAVDQFGNGASFSAYALEWLSAESSESVSSGASEVGIILSR